jgi:hypothetical protein
MKLQRLWQPGTLLFWQMVVFNILSSACGWALRVLPLNTAGLLLIGTLGLLNCAFGMLAMWRLMRDDSAPTPPPAAPASGPASPG